MSEPNTETTATSLPRLRWRHRRPAGFNGVNAYELSRGGNWIAIAQQNRDGMWFWYGRGRNTADRPMALEEAKTEAVAYVKDLGL